jgi:hypothetical protein
MMQYTDAFNLQLPLARYELCKHFGQSKRQIHHYVLTLKILYTVFCLFRT